MRRTPTLRPLLPLLTLLALLPLLLTGCGGTPVSTPSHSATPRPAPARPVAVPTPGACHRLTYDQAVSSVASTTSVPCSQPHTSETYAVGRLHTVVDGHLLALTSRRVQAQVSAACPPALGRYLGGDVRLTLLRPVWFLPTTAQAAAGAQWYRCDVVSVANRAGQPSLTTLTGSLHGVLSGPAAASYAMCGTAKPGTSGFARVQCSAPHTWKAISIVPVTAGPHGAYPGASAAQAAGSAVCKTQGQDHAANALDYQWGYDWPSAQQWAAGQTYGVCWIPAS